MKFTWFRRIAAVAAISLFCPVVSQADNCASSACDDCCYSGDDCCGISGLGCGNGCGDSWFSGAYADVELNFMKSTKEGGVENAFGAGGTFDYEITPRVTLGVLRSDGLGIRTRFWDFSHTARSVGAAADDIQVDAYTWDLEVFERIDLNCNTSIEWSGGVRYTDLIEDLSSGGDFAQTTGFGGVVGLQLNRAVGRGEFYGRARFSIMSDDDAFREFADVNDLLTCSRVRPKLVSATRSFDISIAAAHSACVLDMNGSSGTASRKGMTISASKKKSAPPSASKALFWEQAWITKATV